MKESKRLKKKCLRLSSWVAKRYRNDPQKASQRIMIVWDFFKTKIEQAEAIEKFSDHALKVACGMTHLEAKMKRRTCSY